MFETESKLKIRKVYKKKKKHSSISTCLTEVSKANDTIVIFTAKSQCPVCGEFAKEIRTLYCV